MPLFAICWNWAVRSKWSRSSKSTPAQELDRAIAAGAKIIGVNNRDLRNFDVRLETSLELIESIPEDCIAVSESGLHAHDDLARLRAAGFDAFPDRRNVMKSADPGESLAPTDRHRQPASA